jgi:transcriptional regulator with XRE-family HTH domain
VELGDTLSYTEVSMLKPINISFGNRVRKLRTMAGLSQEQLGEKAGVHRTYIGMIERAEKNITLENIEKIAKALSIRIAKLLEDL